MNDLIKAKAQTSLKKLFKKYKENVEVMHADEGFVVQYTNPDLHDFGMNRYHYVHSDTSNCATIDQYMYPVKMQFKLTKSS